MTEIRRATVDEASTIAAVHARAHFETYQLLLGSMTRALEASALEQHWRQALTDGSGDYEDAIYSIATNLWTCR